MVKLEGKIKKINELEEYGTFQKRTFWLEDIEEKYPNIWLLEVWNKDIPMLDELHEGDFVTAFVDIKGKLTKDATKVINTLKCWNYEKDGRIFKNIN